MNLRKRSKDSGRSDLTRNRLFGALGHVHNPFLIDSHKHHGVAAYKQDETIENLTHALENLRTTSFEAELMKFQASVIAQNLVARFQKS